MTTWRDVLAGKARWSAEASDCLPWLRALPDRCVSLVLFSPPYEAARRYAEANFTLRGQAWVGWLRPIVVECCRVSSGLVLVNAAGTVRDHRYQPVVEWIVADLTRHDGLVCGPSPYAWVRNGVPGSGSKHSGYHRRCWEPVYGFALPDRLPLAWHDQLAFGKPPRFGAGGEYSHRGVDGARANDPWQKRGRGNNLGGWNADGTKKVGTNRNGREKVGRKAPHSPRKGEVAERVTTSPVMWTAPRSGGNGDIGTRETTPPAIACPPNVIRTGNGGNQLGDRFAHENEAPMNLALAERFVCWCCPPDGVVLDPFAGSGTTLKAAVIHGRRAIGCDLRESQVKLIERRMMFAQPSLFEMHA